MASYSGKGVPVNGSVYVCNLPHGTDENMLAEYFGTIGLLKVGGLTRKTKEQVAPRYGYTEIKSQMSPREMLQLPMRIRMQH